MTDVSSGGTCGAGGGSCCQPAFPPPTVSVAAGRWCRGRGAEGEYGREFLSPAAHVWGSQTAQLGLWLPCFWSGWSFCPCPIVSAASVPPPRIRTQSKDRAARPDRRCSSGPSGSISHWTWNFYSLEPHQAVNFLQKTLERETVSQ